MSRRAAASAIAARSSSEISAPVGLPGVEVFDDDVTRSRRISLADWENRPWQEKALEKLASALRLQL